MLFEPHTRQVDGEYRPFVGDFDGDGVDDILWYRMFDEIEGGPSVIWYFDEVGGHQAEAFTIHRDYSPYVADFDQDGCTDILWYRPDEPLNESPLWRCVPGERDFSCDPPVTPPDEGYPIGYGGAY